jgi:4-hydroxy-tetrahydrodipicolinate synthase
MDRREFTQRIGAGVLGASVLASRGKAAEAAKEKTSGAVSRTEMKQWAHEYLKGIENLLMPSFSPDFKSLDEDGIRHDVRQSIKHGFCSSMVVTIGANGEQSKRMMETVREESQGKIMTSTYAGGSAESAIESLAYAAKMGCSYSLLMFPDNLNPQTEDEVYAHYRKVIDSTSLPILLYGTPVAALRQFHPSGIPVNVFDRLADHPTVVGVKLTHPMSAGLAFELCERLSDRLLLGPVNLDLAPVLAKNYRNIQWSGQWIVESVQSPEKPYAVELMDLLSKRRLNEAMKVYWQMEPLIQAIYALQAPLLLHGSHPWTHMKYYQWSTGGNGGLLPLQPAEFLPVLDAKGRQLIREAYKKAGITPVDRPEEEFMVGKMNYAKGIRRANLASTPVYA